MEPIKGNQAQRGNFSKPMELVSGRSSEPPYMTCKLDKGSHVACAFALLHPSIGACTAHCA